MPAVATKSVFDGVAILERAPALPRLGSLLVHVSTSRALTALTTYTAGLANFYGGRLIGVSSLAAPSGPLTQAEEEAGHNILEAAGSQFAELTRSVRAGAAWTCSEGSPSAVLAQYAWAADLIVVGARASLPGENGGDLRRLVAVSDRPVLLHPKVEASGRFERVAVLWADTPACRRAVHSLLPLLGKVQELLLLSTGAPVEALQRSLSLRGVKARIETVRSCGGGPACWAQLRDIAPDLIVAGWPGPLASWLGGNSVRHLVANPIAATLLRS